MIWLLVLLLLLLALRGAPCLRGGGIFRSAVQAPGCRPAPVCSNPLRLWEGVSPGHTLLGPGEA